MGSDDSRLAEYYARRAAEYERIYDKPERREEIERLAAALVSLLAGRDVLEIACGTGFWTERVARSARRVVGVDVNVNLLQIAATRDYRDAAVTFRVADAYRVDAIEGVFSAALAAFWYSHVPRSRIDAFLDGLHGRLGRGKRVVLLDNRYVAGSSTPISRTDASGNSYQQRCLADGSVFEVLKNFPARAELERELGARARALDIVELEYYWYAVYET